MNNFTNQDIVEGYNVFLRLISEKRNEMFWNRINEKYEDDVKKKQKLDLEYEKLYEEFLKLVGYSQKMGAMTINVKMGDILSEMTNYLNINKEDIKIKAFPRNKKDINQDNLKGIYDLKIKLGKEDLILYDIKLNDLFPNNEENKFDLMTIVYKGFLHEDWEVLNEVKKDIKVNYENIEFGISMSSIQYYADEKTQNVTKESIIFKKSIENIISRENKDVKKLMK